MAKIVLITDTHFGIKNSDKEFHANMRLFFERMFLPYLKANEWDTIIHLGDVFHDRRKIDTQTAKLSREYFFQPLHRLLSDSKKVMHIVCGNHDIYHKDNLDTNALNEFISFQDYGDREMGLKERWQSFVVHTEPTEITYDEKLMLIPWITKSNRDQITHAVQKTSARYAFGHLELNGFNWSKVQVSNHGDDPASFSKFDIVFSGHYHYRHSKGNIFYLGSPTQQTWIDVDTKRGFHVLDTETGVVEFIENPYNIFENVKFGQMDIDWTAPNRRHVRLYYQEGTKQSDVDNFVADLYKSGAIHVETRQIHQNTPQNSEETGEEHQVIDSIEDTPTFIRKTVDDSEVAEVLVLLYNQAISEDVEEA